MHEEVGECYDRHHAALAGTAPRCTGTTTPRHMGTIRTTLTMRPASRTPRLAATMIETDFTGHVSTLLAVAARKRAQGRVACVIANYLQ
jgi:hypothetical protein